MKTESVVRLTVDRVVRLTVDRRMMIRALRRIERTFNSLTCLVMNGQHELYTIRGNPSKLYQRCLLCGHETKGWDLGSRKTQLR